MKINNRNVPWILVVLICLICFGLGIFTKFIWDSSMRKPVEIEKKIEIILSERLEKPIYKEIEKPQIISKPAIISVKKEGNIWKVTLNQIGKSLIKKGVRIRIFIDYCYYESEHGSNMIKIDWHPPNINRVGVALFQQTDNPEIGSGKTFCSAILNI